MVRKALEGVDRGMFKDTVSAFCESIDESHKERLLDLITHLHLVPSLRMCGSLLPLPVYLGMALRRRDSLTFYLYADPHILEKSLK
jgi:hypothetical protein